MDTQRTAADQGDNQLVDLNPFVLLYQILLRIEWIFNVQLVNVWINEDKKKCLWEAEEEAAVGISRPEKTKQLAEQFQLIS